MGETSYAKVKQDYVKTELWEFKRQISERKVDGGKKFTMYDLRERNAIKVIRKSGLSMEPGESVQIVLPVKTAAGYTWQVDSEKAFGQWTYIERHDQMPAP